MYPTPSNVVGHSPIHHLHLQSTLSFQHIQLKVPFPANQFRKFGSTRRGRIDWWLQVH
jgi:hypothetical protein